MKKPLFQCATLRKLPTVSLFLIMASCPSMANAEVYKIVDSTGKVIYTDTPPADESGDQLVLPPINQVPGSEIVESAADIAPDSAAFAGYSVVELVAPRDDSLIYYDQQNIIVQLALEPELQIGHLVQFYLNGAAYAEPVAATSYAISNLPRGSHSISARVVAANNGEAVASSRSVTVHVQRHFKRN